MDTVFVKGLEIPCLIGIHEYERRERQPVVFAVELGFDHRRAAASDDITDAIDYADIVTALQQFAGNRDDLLLESLGEACCAFLRQRFAPSHIMLQLEKPQAAETLGCGTVGIKLIRHYTGR
jgi:7,8-dihydroneopterin aldolase/epimerase/oxygenase